MLEIVSLILELLVFILLMWILKHHGLAIEQLQDDYNKRLRIYQDEEVEE